MTALLLLAAAFGAVIAVGGVAVAINDAVERWLGARQEQARGGGGARRVATGSAQRPDPAWPSRPVMVARPPALGRGAGLSGGRRPPDGFAAGARRPS